MCSFLFVGPNGGNFLADNISFTFNGLEKEAAKIHDQKKYFYYNCEVSYTIFIFFLSLFCTINEKFNLRVAN